MDDLFHSEVDPTSGSDHHLERRAHDTLASCPVAVLGPGKVVEAEHRPPAFTELAAMAVVNAQLRPEPSGAAVEQAALRRVATLVARGDPPAAVFTAVAAEVGRVVAAADVTWVGRYDPDGVVEILGGWSRVGDPAFVGMRVRLGGNNVSTRVAETHQSARVDHLTDDSTPATALALEWARSAAGAPINVEGRLWGVMIVGSSQPDGLSAETENKLAAFTELVATAIANTQAREELRSIADEQAALRRVATLVARAAPATEVFMAIAEEVGGLFGADGTGLLRYEPDGSATAVGAHSPVLGVPPGARFPLGGRNVSTLVFETGQPARVDRFPEDDPSEMTTTARRIGAGSAVGAPINVGGRLWGALEVAMSPDGSLPPETEHRLAAFADLAATAIANAQAREELRRVADEQAALRRVATLVAEEAPPAVVFAAVSVEAGRLFHADCALLQYEPEAFATVVGTTDSPHRPAIGTRVPLGGQNTTTRVFETGHPARIDTYSTDDSSPLTMMGRRVGRSAIGAPISVAGHLWGVCVLVSDLDERFSDDTETRLEGFVELVATAIANADARAELTASRARVIAAADETRRRTERDLHDGAQQRLVTLALQLRAVQAMLPPDLGDVAEELEGVARGLNAALDELRDLARGIHPAILVEGGLGPALRSLARRSPIPVEVAVRTNRRLSEPVEVAAYYVVSEALANVAKHARASVAAVDVDADDRRLRVEVRDDGVGGAAIGPGSGLVGLKDRVEALAGRIVLQSTAHGGTILAVELPLGQ